MHIEFLVEDASGKTMLEGLLPKILAGHDLTYKVHSYKGIGGKIPHDFKHDPKMARHRILLDNLPKLLSGYGKAFQNYGPGYSAVVVVVCDLDRRDKTLFEGELNALLYRCEVQPQTRFCLAIEEGEAWFLGDMPAILKAYPNCRSSARANYRQDSICGTWELLADMLYQGGHLRLMQYGYQAVGKEKNLWAEKITPFMDVEQNLSPSFCCFRDTVREIVSKKDEKNAFSQKSHLKTENSHLD